MNYRIKEPKQVVLHAQGGSGGTGYMTGAKTMSREAMQMALEALEGNCTNPAADPEQAANEDAAITALRQALEEKREPVGYFSVNDYGRWEENEGTYGEPLYTAPPKQWVGLTAYEIQEIYSGNQHWGNFACAIEAKLKEKNT